MNFFRQYPDLEAFTQKYGAPHWRDASNRILVKKPRTVNALKAGQPVEIQITWEGLEQPLRLHPRILFWYKTARKRGYEDDLGTFIFECVEAYFEKTGYMLGVLDPPQLVSSKEGNLEALRIEMRWK